MFTIFRIAGMHVFFFSCSRMFLAEASLVIITCFQEAGPIRQVLGLYNAAFSSSIIF